MHLLEKITPYENLTKETLKYIETSQERKERLVIFWLKQKASYPVLRNLLKEIISIKKEIEEQDKFSKDLKDLYEENKLELLNKLEEKKQELEKIAFVVKVDDEKLVNICTKYYDNPDIISQILLTYLWYKPTYPIWISLPLPHCYLFKDLIKNKESKTTSENSELTIQDISKPIPKDKLKQDQEKTKEDFEKEQIQQLQNVFIEKITSLYTNYLETHLDNSYFENPKGQQKLLNFIKNDLINFIKRLHKYWNIPEYIAKELKIQINHHIQTFDKDVLNQLDILWNFIEDMLKAKNEQQIGQIYKNFIFKLREIDNNDSWINILNPKDANLYQPSYELLINESLDFITNKEIKKRIEKIAKLDINFINKIEKLYYQPSISINWEKVQKEYWDKNWNVHLNKEWLIIIHKQIRNYLIEKWINIKWAINDITKKFDKLFLYNQTDYLSVYEKIKQDLKQNQDKEKLKLLKRNFEKDWKIDLSAFKQFYLNLEKAYLLENIKLTWTNWLLNSEYTNNDEFRKYRQENKVFELYCDINWIWTGEFSDIQENIAKFWLKELLTEVVFLALSAFWWEIITWVRIAQLTRKLKQVKTIEEAEKLKDKIKTLKILSYPTTGVWFHYSYTSLENIKNGENLFKNFTDIKGLIKDMILIGILKWINDFKPLRNKNLPKDFDNFRDMNIIDIVEEIWKTHNKLTSKILWVSLETWIVYTAWNWVNIMLDDSLQDERDLLIAFGLVVWLRWANKAIKYIAYKDEKWEVKLRELEEEKLKPVMNFINKDWIKILKNFKTKVEEKYKKSVEELTKKELDFELKNLKLELRAKIPDTYKWQKWVIVNTLINEFKRYVEERKVKDKDPDTGYNQTKIIWKLPWELAEVIEKAKFKDGKDYIEKLLWYFQKQGKIPTEEEILSYIEMYVETRAKEEENIAENYYKKAVVSEEAKVRLKKELVKEYKEVLKKIEQANEWRTIEEKINKLVKWLKEINELEYKRIIERLEKYKEEILKGRGKKHKKRW